MIDSAILPSLWICTILVLAAGLMMRRHLHVWRAVRADESCEAHEFNYRRRQYYRRMQTSGLLGILGVAILVGHFVKPPASDLAGNFRTAIVLVTVYWSTVLLMVAWVLVLAFFDAISTRMYYGRIRRRNESEQELMEARLLREQREAAAEGLGEHEQTDE